MGYEAERACRRDREPAKVKVLLEAGELILLGGTRRSITLKELRDLQVTGGELCLVVGEESISLTLDSAEAVKWAKNNSGSATTVDRSLVVSESQKQAPGTGEEALCAHLENAARSSGAEGNLVVACIHAPEAFVAALEESSKRLAKGMPIWIVYPARFQRLPSKLQEGASTRKVNQTKVTTISPRPDPPQ